MNSSGFAKRAQPVRKPGRVNKGGRTLGRTSGGRTLHARKLQAQDARIPEIVSSIRAAFTAISEKNPAILVEFVEFGNPAADTDLLVSVMIDMLSCVLARDLMIEYSHEKSVQITELKDSDHRKIPRYTRLVEDAMVVISCEYRAVLIQFKKVMDRSEITESILGREHLMKTYLLAMIRGYIDSKRSKR